MGNEAYWVRLSCALGAGNHHADDILMNFSDAKEFFDAGEDAFRRVKTLTDREISRIKSFSLGEAESICEKAEKENISILTPDMNEFPVRLKNIPACPLTLYVKGDCKLISDMDNIPAIAVVGTRKASEYGNDIAYRLSYDMASAGAAIVSGMALGIDSAANRGALDADGKTIAVLGCGVDVCYPEENSELMEKIIAKGAVVSELAPNSEPKGSNFPVRNRLMSGLSLGVLMVEAKLKSGALITVKHAMEQGKDIFTVPMSLYEKNAASSLALIRDGATAVGCARHILEEYYSDYFSRIDLSRLSDPSVEKLDDKKYRKNEKERKSEPETAVKRRPIETTDETTTAVYNSIGRSPKHINEIAAETALSVTKVLSALTTLEMLGMAEALPGRRYVLL